MEVNPNGIYDRHQLAEILRCSIRTIDYYYTLGLPRKKIRSKNYTTGRQLLQFIESQDSESENPKLIKFRQECL
ncbi:MAG: hypothetical protein ACOX4U_00620 [Anaerovoracaceae bacterium]|jgi:phage terminase Nu1 subunit (DNA packaging protein)